MKLETDHGTFEAETMKELSALARKAKRQAEKDAKERYRRYDEARVRAERNGFRVLKNFLGAFFYGDKVFVHYELHTPENAGSWWNDYVREGDGGHVARYETTDGVVPYHHKGSSVRGLLMDRAGFPVAVVLYDRANGPTEVYALGFCEGTVDLVELDVPVGDFAGVFDPKEKTAS